MTYVVNVLERWVSQLPCPCCHATCSVCFHCCLETASAIWWSIGVPPKGGRQVRTSRSHLWNHAIVLRDARRPHDTRWLSVFSSYILITAQSSISSVCNNRNLRLVIIECSKGHPAVWQICLISYAALIEIWNNLLLGKTWSHYDVANWLVKWIRSEQP